MASNALSTLDQMPRLAARKEPETYCDWHRENEQTSRVAEHPARPPRQKGLAVRNHAAQAVITVTTLKGHGKLVGQPGHRRFGALRRLDQLNELPA